MPEVISVRLKVFLGLKPADIIIYNRAHSHSNHEGSAAQTGPAPVDVALQVSFCFGSAPAFYIKT
jgi:hypothetical protein